MYTKLYNYTTICIFFLFKSHKYFSKKLEFLFLRCVCILPKKATSSITLLNYFCSHLKDYASASLLTNLPCFRWYRAPEVMLNAKVRTYLITVVVNLKEVSCYGRPISPNLSIYHSKILTCSQTSLCRRRHQKKASSHTNRHTYIN